MDSINTQDNIAELESSHYYTQTDIEIIAKLAKMPKIVYDRLRKQVSKELGIQIKTLDGLVKESKVKANASESAQNGLILFKEPKPWGEPVNLGELLTELTDTFNRFAVLTEHSDIAMALWVCFSWCIDAANTAPILAISSPEKRCGKTTVLSLLNLLVKRPLSTSNITPAALFRAIEEYKPTLLIDEADTFIKQSDDLRGILNSGHTRSTAFVLRTVGDEHVPKAFNTWGAKAIALIGKLPDTLHDRSIVIPLKRKLTHEKTERLYRTDYNFDLIKSKLARFADDYAEDVKEVVPKSLNHVSDRAADNWEVLLAIASLAGKEWEDRTTKAIMALSDKSGEPKTYGVTLLADIKEIFESKNVDKIFSGDLITELCNDKEKPWSTFRHGNPIDQRVLANLLKEFAIVSKSIRINSQNLKGYEFDQFADTFSRYTPISPNFAVTTSQLNVEEACNGISLPSQNNFKNLSDTLYPATSKDCDVVTAKTPKNTPVDEYLLEERAAIMEYDGGLTREEAELAVWGRVITKNGNGEN